MLDRSQRGFTLVEVLIALSITAVVAVLAYGGLSAVINSVEGTRTSSERVTEVQRAWNILSRDIRQFAPRPIRDEFGQSEGAMIGGENARFLLSLTRAGWHNPNGLLRSELQRVNYVFEDNALWRESYPVLDRAPDTEPQRVKLLDEVEEVRVRFLANIGDLQVESDGLTLDMRNWQDTWLGVPETGGTGSALPTAGVAPAAVELTVTLPDWGELRRVYELPAS